MPVKFLQQRLKGCQEYFNANRRLIIILLVLFLITVSINSHRHIYADFSKTWFVDAYWDTAELLRNKALGDRAPPLEGISLKIEDMSYIKGSWEYEILSMIEPDTELAVPLFRRAMERPVYPTLSAFVGLIIFPLHVRIACMIVSALAVLFTAFIILRITELLKMSEIEKIGSLILFFTSTVTLTMTLGGMPTPLAHMFGALSLYFLLKYEKTKNNKDMIIFMAFTSVAILTREILILLSVLPLVYYTLNSSGISKSKRILMFIIPPLIFFLYLYSANLLIPELANIRVTSDGFAEKIMMETGKDMRSPLTFFASNAEAFGLGIFFFVIHALRNYKSIYKNPLFLWVIIYFSYFAFSKMYFGDKIWYQALFAVSIVASTEIYRLSKGNRLIYSLLYGLCIAFNAGMFLVRVFLFNYY